MAENTRELPGLKDYFNPVLRALHELGGTGTNQEIHDRVVIIMALTNDEIRQLHNKGKGNTTKVAYQMGWARTYLKQYGLLENTGRARWSLTAQGRQTQQVDPKEVYNFVLRDARARNNAKPDTATSLDRRLLYGDKVMATSKDLPPAQELLIFALQALREMGGTARKRDISARVKELASLTDEQTQLMYGSGSTTVYSIVINDVRKILVTHGLITIPQTGIYRLTDAGWEIKADELANLAQAPARRRAPRSVPAPETTSLPTIPIDEFLAQPTDWRTQLHDRLYSLSESQLIAFFEQILADFGKGTVEVMQSDRKRDIDGLFTKSGLFDMRICFRFALGERLLGSNEVAELRSYANSSGADIALYLTAGKFTEAALQEAARNLNPKVQLLDGEQLASTMKRQGMGVRSERVIVERVIIDEGWFAGL